jgi:predicted O-methyltransferase YrrM
MIDADSELRHINPTERCPCPQFWHSTDSESTELEVTELIHGLVRGLQPRCVVETGAAFGQTTRRILDALDANGHGTLITCEVDPGRQQELGEHPRMIKRGDSLAQDVSEWAPIDFAFFDSFPWFRPQEFRHYRQWMRVGTVVAFHDTAEQAAAGDGAALRSEIETLDLVVIDLSTPRGLTLSVIN